MRFNGMLKDAYDIYTSASATAGRDESFTRAIARLVGNTATNFDDLASRFACEAEIMQRASELARSRARIEDKPVNIIEAALRPFSEQVGH
jgi:hypothetical protein